MPTTKLSMWGTCIQGKKVCHIDGLRGQSISLANNFTKLIQQVKPEKDSNPPKRLTDFSNMKRLGEGSFGEVYSDGKGNAYKVEKPLEAGMIPIFGRSGLEQYKSFRDDINKNVQEPAYKKGYAPEIKDLYLTDDDRLITIMEELDSSLKNVATLPENEKPSKEEYLKAQEWFIKNGIVHGDLQEKNVMYNPETKKLMFVDFDFGWSNDGKPLSKLDADEDWDYLL